MTSKFKSGQRVYYPHLQRYGTIHKIINEQDSADIRAQGYRYEVFFTGEMLRSIPESALSTIGPRGREIDLSNFRA